MFSVRFGSGPAMLTGMTIKKGGNLWNSQNGDFGPQLGFAWTPDFYHQRVVIRGGFGLNYNQNEIAITGNVNGNPGLTVSPNFSMSLPTSPNPGILYYRMRIVEVEFVMEMVGVNKEDERYNGGEKSF